MKIGWEEMQEILGLFFKMNKGNEDQLLIIN